MRYAIGEPGVYKERLRKVLRERVGKCGSCRQPLTDYDVNCAYALEEEPLCGNCITKLRKEF